MIFVNILQLQLIYFWFLLIFFFFFGYYKIFILIFIIHLSYLIERKGIMPFIYRQNDQNIDVDECYTQDQDIDSSYLINLLNEELYLIYRCRFLFEYYGGTSTLSIDDYYILSNIYENIYSSSDKWINVDININNFTENCFDLYKKKFYLLNIFNKFSLLKYNLLKKTNYIEDINLKKKIKLLKLVKKNDIKFKNNKLSINIDK